MDKPKRELLSPDMRQRLLANREGKLIPGQWLDMVMQPLVTLLILLGPALIVLGPRLLLNVRGVLVALLTLVVVFGAMLLVRARRYARLPVKYAVLYAGVHMNPFWAFWRPTMFYTASDEPVKFNRQLAPRMPTRIDGEYVVYYLEEESGRVLLSMCPTDHKDIDKYLPTDRFKTRYTRRTAG